MQFFTQVTCVAPILIFMGGCANTANPPAEEPDAASDAIQADSIADDILAVDTALTPDTTDTTDTADTTDTTDTTNTNDTTNTTNDTNTTDTNDTATTPTYRLSLDSWTMAPGEERTRCVVKRLDNPSPVYVNRIHTSLAPGSHHFIVYRSSDTEERTTPFDCTPFSQTLGGTTVPLMISQTRSETVALPDGVFFELAANQMIRLEAHFLNYFPNAITTSAEVVFDTAAPSNPIRADFMFYGTTQVFVPARQSVTTPWHWHSVPNGVSVFGLTGHTHALGTNVEVEQSRTANTNGTSVYPPPNLPFDWAEAPVAHFNPPLSFANDGFRFRCSWNNTTDQTVTFGESANQEMCFFWAYYYPSQGFILKF